MAQKLPGAPGILDGQPMRFTLAMAWWLVDGAWRKADLADALNNGSVMTEANFEKMFPDLPPLHADAFKR